MTAHANARPSRRERPAKPALSRAGIIATAVALMRAEGLEKVTMRRLAQELDTGPASLYVYVRNTAELHAAVLDELLGSVDLGAAGGDGDWGTAWRGSSPPTRRCCSSTRRWPGPPWWRGRPVSAT